MAPTTISEVPFPSRSATHANPTEPGMVLVPCVMLAMVQPGSGAPAVCAPAGAVLSEMAAIKAVKDRQAPNNHFGHCDVGLILFPRAFELQRGIMLTPAGSCLGFLRRLAGPKTTLEQMPERERRSPAVQTEAL